MELLVAIAIMGFAVVAMGQFTSHVNRGLRDRELSARIDWELQNARERIGALAPESITAEQIAKLPVSASLANWLHEPKFITRIEQMETPVKAIQVTLALECGLNGQTAQPAVITFWVRRNEGQP